MVLWKQVLKIIMTGLLITMIAGNVFAIGNSEKNLSAEDLLREGVRNDDPEKVQEALKKGASPDTLLYEGGYPVIENTIGNMSQYQNAYEIAKILIENGANLDFLNGGGKGSFSSLHEYCTNDEIIKLLVINGVKVHHTGLLEQKYWDYPMCKFLLENGADPDRVIHKAAAMDPGAATNCKIVNQRGTQRCISGKRVKRKILKLLLEHGANVNAMDEDCKTPLHRAVKTYRGDKERINTVKYLIENGADVNALAGCDEYKENALKIHLDSQEPQFDIAEILVEHGLRLPQKRIHYTLEYTKDSLLLGLIASSHLDMIPGEDLYKKIIRICSKKCNVSVMEKLFQAKWNPVIDTKLLTTSFKYAARGGNSDTARFLVKKGARISRTEFKNKEYDLIEIEDLLAEYEEKNAGMQRDLNKDLYNAVCTSNVNHVKDLLEKGVDPDGSNCLHVAVENYDFEIIKSLVAAGADVNKKDKEYMSPLMYACLSVNRNLEKKGFNLIKYLVENGAKINAPLKNTEKTGHILCNAVIAGDLKVIEFLLKAGADPNGIHPYDMDRRPVLFAIKPVRMGGVGRFYFSNIRHNAQLRAKKTGCINPYSGPTTTLEIERKDKTLDILKLLVRYGADVKTVVDEDGDSPLYYALDTMRTKFIIDEEENIKLEVTDADVNIRIIRYLIENECDINSDDYFNIARTGSMDLFNLLDRQKRITNYHLMFGGAVAGGKIDLAKHVIDKLSFKDQEDKAGFYTKAISVAIENDQGKIIDYLVTLGARIAGSTMSVKRNHRDHHDSPLIIAAAHLSHLNSFKTLYHYGINIDAFDVKGRNILMAAADQGSGNIVDFLVKQKEPLDTVSPKNGKTAMIYAANCGIQDQSRRYNIIVKLLANGADPSIKDNDDHTALDYALGNRKYNTAAVLMISSGKGMDTPEFLEHADSFMESLSRECNADLFKNYYEKLPVKKPQYAGAALIGAVKNGCVEITRYMLDQKLNLRSYSGEALLVAASLKPDTVLPILKDLLNADTPLNKKDKNGKTALLIALENKDDDKAVLAKTLLKYNVNVNVHTMKGVTPLIYAAVRSEKEMVKTLIDKNAKINYQMKTKDRVKYLKILSYNLKVLMTSKKKYKEFKKNMKAASRNCSYKGNTALMSAASQHDDSVVALLLNTGAKVNISNDNGDTPLFYAASSGNYTSASLIIDKGADINRINYEGLNALMIAAGFGHKNIVKLFLQKGVDPDIQDCSNGFTALMYAAQSGHLEVVKTLIEHGCKKDITTYQSESTAIGLTDDLDIKELLLK